MSTSKLRFYLDENMNPEIAIQLVRHGIDVMSARDAGMLHAADCEQLRFAAECGRMICTEDTDFVDPATVTAEHAGIVFFPGGNRGVGTIVKALRELHSTETTETMNNSITYR